MKHICDCSARCYSIDSDLLAASILGHNSHKRINSTLGTRVDRVVWYTEVLGRVGRRQNNAAALIEMAIRLTSNEELAASVKAEHTVKFLLLVKKKGKISATSCFDIGFLA